MNIHHHAAFTSRFSILSLGLRPCLCLTIEKKPSPCAVHSLYIKRKCVHKFVLCLRCLSFLKRRVSSYCLNLQRNSGVPGLLLSRRVSSYLHPELHLFAILENSTLPLDCVLSLRAFRRNRILYNQRTCRDSEGQVHAIGWFTDEELVETIGVKFIAVGFDFATVLFSPSIALVWLVKLKF